MYENIDYEVSPEFDTLLNMIFDGIATNQEIANYIESIKLSPEEEAVLSIFYEKN